MGYKFGKLEWALIACIGVILCTLILLPKDMDNDAIVDDLDNCPETPNPEQIDTDHDLLGDACDEDDDNDTVVDADDAFPLDSQAQFDTDNDGISNALDNDDDGDQVLDISDAFPLDASAYLDSDLDGVSDQSDAFPFNSQEAKDSDGDGVGDNQDDFPNDASEIADTDKDGKGNRIDEDDDNDDIPDVQDAFPLDPQLSLDKDADGVDAQYDLDDKQPELTTDIDADGINDAQDPTLRVDFATVQSDSRTQLILHATESPFTLKVNHQTHTSTLNQRRAVFDNVNLDQQAALTLQANFQREINSATVRLSRPSPWKRTHNPTFKPVTHRNKVWLIGGIDTELSNDVWHSDDGIHWFKVKTQGPIFSPRTLQQVVVFRNKLWVIGGRVKLAGIKRRTSSDIWSSEDGVHWHQESESSALGEIDSHVVVAFNQHLWSYGGGRILSSEEFNQLKNSRKRFQARTELWKSPNGVHWFKVNEDARLFSQINEKQPTSFQKKMWLFSVEREILSSTDGIKWTVENSKSPISMKRKTFNRVVELDHTLYMLGDNVVWRSKDAIQWDTQSKTLNVECRNDCTPYVYKQAIHLSGANIFSTYYTGKLKQENKRTGLHWISKDGVKWDNQEKQLDKFRVATLNDTLFLYPKRALKTEGYVKDMSFVDTWYSKDGMQWQKSPSQRTFSLATVAEHNGKLWSISESHKTEWWKTRIAHSSDGQHWKTDLEKYWKIHTGGKAALQSFKGKLWLQTRDQKVKIHENNQWTSHTVKGLESCRSGWGASTVFKDRMWFTCRDDKLLSSTDGILWSLEYDGLPIRAEQIIALHDHMYIFGFKSHKDRKRNHTKALFRSKNGYQWDEVKHPFIGEIDQNATLVKFKDEIWIIKGQFIYHQLHTNIVKSQDGEHWTNIKTGQFSFSHSDLSVPQLSAPQYIGHL